MSKPLLCAAAPCGSCPYRRDVPCGVWDESEYKKLMAYSLSPGEMPAMAVFLCHQTNATGQKTVCRGWLTVERDSIAVRLALLQGSVTPEQVYAAPLVPLYETSEEAAEAGMSGVRNPSREAKRLVSRLLRKGAGRP